MNILIVYGSLEGQTEKIAEYVGDILRQKNHQVSIQSGKKLPEHFSASNYDAAIIGGPIHMGKYPTCIKEFIADDSSPQEY